MSESNRPELVELYHAPEEISQLVAAFDACTLPQKQWTHYAHLTVGLWYVVHYPIEEATQRIRLGIQKYNESCGVKMTKDGGYHDTITLFYIWAIRQYLAGVEDRSSLVVLTNGLLNSRYGDRKFPLEYYSKDVLMSWDARLHWVEPDIKPLEEGARS